MKKVAVLKVFASLGFLLAFLIMLPVARADDWNQATKFTFSQPVHVPGRTLPAGTYLFQMVDGSDREIVRIWAEDRTTLFATIFTVPCQRPARNTDAAITLADRGATQPEAIVAWFYAGNTQGHEILYTKQEAKELARNKHETVLVGD